jgi:hypothetical protein
LSKGQAKNNAPCTELLLLARTYHIAKFFGIAVHLASAEKNLVKLSLHPRYFTVEEQVLEGEVLDRDDKPISEQEPMPRDWVHQTELVRR